MALIDTIAKNIKKHKRSMSYFELSQKSGVPYRTLENIVFYKKIKEPRLSTLSKLAKALNVSVDQLIG